MASTYNDETVLSKLSALNDSQDAIVAVAQWIMFHRYAFPGARPPAPAPH